MAEKVSDGDLLQFDDNGNLIVGCHECDLESFIEKFLNNYPDSETRKSRMELFINFLKNFDENIKNTRRLLLNGGFTTNKTNPCDVDFVIVLNAENLTVYEKKYLSDLFRKKNVVRDPYLELERLIEEEGRSKRELMDTEFYDFGCDFFYLKRRKPDEGEKYELYKDEKDYWLKWWGHTRPDKKTGIKYPKGMVNISYEKLNLEGL